MSTQQTSPIHRGRGDVGDIFSHIIPHLENMDPKQIRKNVSEVVINFFQKNEQQIHPQTASAVLHKLDVLLKLPDPLLAAGVVNFTVWFDKLGAEFVGVTAPRVDLKEPETDKTPFGILDALHYDYGLSWVGMKMRVGKKGADILVGNLHNNIPYSLAREIAAAEPKHVRVVLAEGSVRGQIMWVCAGRDSMSVKVEHLEGGYHVFESVFEALPWLKTERLKKEVTG